MATGWFGIKDLVALPRRRGPAPTQVLGRGRHMGATSDRAWPPKGSGGRGRDQRPRSRSRKCGGCGQWAPVDQPRAAVVPPPQPGVTGSQPVPYRAHGPKGMIITWADAHAQDTPSSSSGHALPAPSGAHAQDTLSSSSGQALPAPVAGVSPLLPAQSFYDTERQGATARWLSDEALLP